MSTEITFEYSDVCFEAAIRQGRLSEDPGAANYAGNFMYMGTQTASLRPMRQQRELFKNRDTREYLP